MVDPSEAAAGRVSEGFKALILVPSYNTGRRLIGTVEKALAQWQPVWVVVDGSDDGSAEALEILLGDRQGLCIIARSENGGKGAAVLSGARQALREGFTHVLCLDTDGQHPDDRITAFMNAARQNPEAMVLGQPVFDESAPAIRVQGRKLSKYLVALEILGSDIGDALYGMRIYPLRPLVERMESISGARRYDFEPCIAVHLFWDAAKAVPRGGLIIIRNCLNDGSWRFAVTQGGDWLAKKTFWMRDHAHSYPKRYEIEGILSREGFEGGFQPLWGRTPFSNYLGVYEKQ